MNEDILIKMKLGIYQIETQHNKIENLNKTREAISMLADKGSNMVLLPECFNSPYGIEYFKEYSEVLDKGNISFDFFSDLSNQYPEIYFFFGSIPEKDQDKIYNTMAVFYQGIMIDKYRKIHLYDINIKGKHSFQESKVLSPGEDPVIIKTIYGNIGIGICYDLRFPKLAEYYMKNDCKLIVYPGAFNLITGEAHWELLQRARALDNMLFIATASTARNKDSDYKSWGNSSIINPWGKVINKLDEKEGTIIQEINFMEIDEIRNSIPTFKNLRKIDYI